MASPYPSGFDNFPTDTADASVAATDHHNDLADAINKIQTTLGLNPEVALAHTPFGPDLVTGDSQTFLTGLGDWIEVGGGTLTWEDVNFSHPLNPKAGMEGLKFVASANGDLIRLPVAGTFLAGQPYVALLLLRTDQDPDLWWIYFGEDGGADGGSADLSSGDWRLLAVTWIPTADRSAVVVEVGYNGAATPTWEAFYCKVAERRDYLAAAGFSLAGAAGGSLGDKLGDLVVQFPNVTLMADNTIDLIAGGTVNVMSDVELSVAAPSAITLATNILYLFEAAGITPGLSAAARPALETATTEGEVIAGYNLIRTMLISLGLATDGD